MHINFDPPLCQLATLVLPTQAGQHDLRFRATFDSRESYQQARRDGTRVEMWTDLPVAGTAYEGGWRALTFDFEDGELLVDNPNVQGNATFSSSNVASVTISPAAKEKNEKYGEEVSVYLSVRLSSENIVPPFPGAEMKYSFTYRILYPHGGVEWLGEYGRNGVFLVRRGETRLQYTRDVNSDDGLEVVSSEVPSGEEVARLSHEFIWESWAAGKTGRPVFSPTSATAPSSSVLLIPRLPAGGYSLVSPQPITLSASSGSLISVSSSGVITASSPEGSPSNVYFLSGDHAQDTFLASLRGSTQVVKYDSESGFIILASAASDEREVVLPITLSFIPISSKSQFTTYASLNATLRAFASLLPPPTEDEREIVLYHKRLGVISCITVPPSVTTESLNLRVSSAGDQVVLAPLYEVPTKERIEKFDPWKVSVLTPHGPVKVVSPESLSLDSEGEVSSTLPSPPQSPRFFRTEDLRPDIQTVLESSSGDVKESAEAQEADDDVESGGASTKPELEVLESEAVQNLNVEESVVIESETEEEIHESEEDHDDDAEEEEEGEEIPTPVPEEKPKTRSVPSQITGLVSRAVQEADKRVGFRAARSIFFNRPSLVRMIMDFSVQVLFTRFFGALGFVLAFIGWRKRDNGRRIEEIEDEDPAEEQVSIDESSVEIEEGEATPVPAHIELPELEPEQEPEVHIEEEDISLTSPLIEETTPHQDDETQSEATVVEDDHDMPSFTSPQLPGALDLSDMHPVEYLPHRLSAQLHSRLAALLLRSPYSSPDSSPTEITITLNGKPVTALYHKVPSLDQRVPYHLFEFTATTNGADLEISSTPAE